MDHSPNGPRLSLKAPVRKGGSTGTASGRDQVGGQQATVITRGKLDLVWAKMVRRAGAAAGSEGANYLH